MRSKWKSTAQYWPQFSATGKPDVSNSGLASVNCFLGFVRRAIESGRVDR